MSRIYDYISTDIKLDAKQLRLIELLENVRTEVFHRNIFQLFKTKKYKGAYIYGPVGRGKTIIARAFFDSLALPKKFYHYHEFLRYVHEESHKLFQQKNPHPINSIAKNIAKDQKAIFIDELEIRDITDAMLIQNIYFALKKLDVFIFFTSNIEPKNLYLDGIQRQSFMKFIHEITSNFFVYCLDSDQDYRFAQIAAKKNLILYPSNDTNRKHFVDLVQALRRNAIAKSHDIELFGRKVGFKKIYHNNILHTGYDELFTRELSYNDFLAIVNHFEAIIIDKIEKIEESSDHILRFINFFDAAYAHKILIVALFEKDIGSLLPLNKYGKEFQRAVSRITEMNSKNYINSTKYYHLNE